MTGKADYSDVKEELREWALQNLIDSGALKKMVAEMLKDESNQFMDDSKEEAQ